MYNCRFCRCCNVGNNNNNNNDKLKKIRNMSYRDRLVKLSLLPLEYRREMKDLVLIYNARAGYIDLGHQYFFYQNVGLTKTRNSSELNYKIPHGKQNYLKHSFYYRSINFWNYQRISKAWPHLVLLKGGF